jgi:malonyl-CoA/methylmalonyl-CoA synthetase
MPSMTDLIVDRFRRVATATPDAPFLIHPDGAVLTYNDAWRQSARMANLFRALGIQPGDRIALQAEKSASSLLAYLAAMQVGAVFLPLNTAYTAHEVAFFLGDAAPALLICRDADEAAMQALCASQAIAHMLSLDAAGQGSLVHQSARYADSVEPAVRHPDDLAAILYTSGTTGRSKGAMLTQDNLASNAAALTDCWRFTATDRLLHALPIYHTHGLFVATNVSIWAGSAMIRCSACCRRRRR